MKKNCSKCGTIICKKNKSGVCKKCYDWSGSNNPFFGRKHSDSTIEKIKKTNSAISKKHWIDPEYRKKVISGVSKPRRESFKKEQSDRVAKWYVENPEQKDIRSLRMKKTWADGKIEPTVHSFTESKKEIEMREEIAKALPGSRVEKKTIKIDGRWYYPDVLIDDWIVVEFFGNYWHANPEMYKENDEVHHGFKACDIWEKDKKRLAALRKRYHVLVVWEKAYKNGQFDLDDFVYDMLMARDDG
jgi:G:T-mismatch repair DNA endonuclease (very short patch repair protein)